MKNLNQMIREAQRREDRDEHLNTEERKELIRRFQEENLDFESSGDIDNDFIDIIL